MQHRHYLTARLEGLKSAVFKLRVVLVLVDMVRRCLLRRLTRAR